MGEVRKMYVKKFVCKKRHVLVYAKIHMFECGVAERCRSTTPQTRPMRSLGQSAVQRKAQSQQIKLTNCTKEVLAVQLNALNKRRPAVHHMGHKRG